MQQPQMKRKRDRLACLILIRSCRYNIDPAKTFSTKKLVIPLYRTSLYFYLSLWDLLYKKDEFPKMPPLNNKTVIVIAGPTAVGKTAVAIELAEHFKTEIISADSRQCFKELNIGVARPSEDELRQLRHHFIASHSIRDEVNAAGFEEYALEKTAELFKQHETVIMVGGTGLYIKAFCEGLDEIPAIDPAVRENIIKTYQEKGLTGCNRKSSYMTRNFIKWVRYKIRNA